MQDVLKDDRESRLLFPCIGYKKLPLRVKPFASAAPNAGGEPRAMAGATQARRLLRVGSTAWFGGVCLPRPNARPHCRLLHRRSSTPQRTPAPAYLITSSA